MALEAMTLAVFSTLHLSGALHIGSGSRHSYGAGVAEALICVALAGGAFTLARSPGRRGRRVALSALAFAIFGFFVGLSFTLDSGDTVDLAYHLAMLPVLGATAALLIRRRA
jgi:multisubunit Na+/H+ antiporter MnhF subunit